MKRMFPYDFDLCAARKKVALCDQYSNDFLNADVRGKCVWCNGPFGMSAQLAAHLPHCGARHITWLTLASVNSKWFHTDVLPHAKHILFPTRRLAFRGYDNVTKWDVMLVLYGVIPKHMTHGITCSGIELP
jgi:hypothetical protein